MDLNRQILHKATSLSLDKSSAEQLGTLLASVTDWQGLIRDAELYALANILLKHITEHDLPVANEHLVSLKGLAFRHKNVANTRYKVISQISDKFAKHDIPLVALKGLALAPMIYPQERFRPMRDMDILVPKDKEQVAAEVLRNLGFKLPYQQQNKFMRGSHQLPNATLKVDGFTISVEIHHDAFSRDVAGSLTYQDIVNDLQSVQWRDTSLMTLGHTQMLHQVSRHLEGLHPGAVLKLINVLDVVRYAEQFIDDINWNEIKSDYSHVINTLQCLHLITPLSDNLQAKIGGVIDVQPNGVGEIMQPLTSIFNKTNSTPQKLRLLLKPSDWWLHLYYNVSLNNSLSATKYCRHPIRVMAWLWKRFYSMIMGG